MIYFLSILGGEFIKIGFTEQAVEKRKAALQTGNPYKIDVLFFIDGPLVQEKEVHKSLREVFDRVKVFGMPINEWYPGNNPVIKMFLANVNNHGIIYAIKNLNTITRWDGKVGDGDVFTIRNLERALRKNGFSRSRAKQLISENKIGFMERWMKGEQLPSAPLVLTNNKRPNYVLRKGPAWVGQEKETTNSQQL